METPVQMDTAKLVSNLTAAGLKPIEIENTHHILVPPNYSHKELTDLVEKARYTPNRKKGTVNVSDVPSLLTYMAEQKCAGTGYVYADPDDRTITTVFNDHRAGPGWRDHRAVFKAVHTPEFLRWVAKDKQMFSQSEFAEFIEDNFADLAGDDAGLLLTVATTIAATTGINFASARRLDNGQTQLTYNESIDANAGVNGEMKIPQKFTLGLRIFKNGDGYAMTARLKYRLHSGSVKFFYELERPERAIEDAFKGYVDKVTADASKYTVLIGKAA